MPVSPTELETIKLVELKPVIDNLCHKIDLALREKYYLCGSVFVRATGCMERLHVVRKQIREIYENIGWKVVYSIDGYYFYVKPDVDGGSASE